MTIDRIRDGLAIEDWARRSPYLLLLLTACVGLAALAAALFAAICTFWYSRWACLSASVCTGSPPEHPASETAHRVKTAAPTPWTNLDLFKGCLLCMGRPDSGRPRPNHARPRPNGTAAAGRRERDERRPTPPMHPSDSSPGPDAAGFPRPFSLRPFIS